jgi:hypothetical protein
MARSRSNPWRSGYVSTTFRRSQTGRAVCLTLRSRRLGFKILHNALRPPVPFLT